MRKNILKVVACFLFLLLMVIFVSKEASAYTEKSSTSIGLSYSTKHMAFSFNMPKDGKIKLNISVKDRDIVPGSLTFSIQTAYAKDSTKIKEISGITSSNGIVDMEIELSKGDYYFHYDLNNATGDLLDTSLMLFCEAEILPTIVENISALSIHNITSFDELTEKGYEEIKFGDKEKDCVLPFTVKNVGGVFISMAEKDGDYEKLQARIYKEKECINPIGKSFSLKMSGGFTNVTRDIPAKGTYYIKFTLNNENPVGVSNFKVKLYTINGEARVLAPAKATVAYQSSDNKKIIYKINVKSNGLIAFELTPYDNTKGGSAKFQLLNKSKKAITENSYVTSYQNDDGAYSTVYKYYTVTKGVYYLQVEAGSSLYQIEHVFVEGESEAGTSKAKAKTLKIGGKAAAGYFTISDKTTKVDWYKFTVSKDQNIKAQIAYRLDGNFEYEIQDSMGKVLYNSNKEIGVSEGFYNTWASNVYSKGTYYIKVYKGNKSSSFDYAIAVK